MANLKLFNLDDNAGNIIAVANIICDARIAEIASAGGQATTHSPGAGINLQVIVEQWQNKIFMLVPMPHGAILGLR